MDILVRRSGASGDVLMATAILPAIKKLHPQCTIYFETQCPAVLLGNPFIDFIVNKPGNRDYSLVVDLDLAYENRPDESMLKCYADVLNVPLGWCVPYVSRAKVNKPLLEEYIVFHAGMTKWAGRNWDRQKWRDIAMKVHESGHQIICVGRRPDLFVPCDVDCRDITSIPELATIIEDAKLFVGIDSLPFNIAQVVHTRCVTFFGSIKPELRIINPWVKPVVAKNLACLGCHHRQKAPALDLPSCPIGTLECETNVSVDDMWSVIVAELEFNRA